MKIGIILPHLMSSQLSYEVLNIVNNNQNKHEYTIFYENIAKLNHTVFCPVMNVSEMKHFTGRLIGFTLSAAEYMNKSIRPVESILYWYNLEWLSGKTDYVSNVKVLRRLPVYSRSDDYAKLISNYANIECKQSSLESLLCP